MDRTADSIRYQQAKALTGLGDAHAALDDHRTAATHWRQAHDIFRELDVPEAQALADR